MNDVVHKILRKDVMLDGTHIQIEDWKEVYPEVEKTIMIAAYPIAKNGGYWINKGETFRLQISLNFSSDREVEYLYKGLVNGDIKLEDLSSHYWDGERAKRYMGLED